MAGLLLRKRLEKPLLLGSILCVLAALFVHRHRFLPKMEARRAREYEYYEQKRLDIVQRRQKQLAEQCERKASEQKASP